MALPSALLKVGDNITTDHIMPAGSKILPYRSNIPYLANFCFEVCDADFAKRAMKAEGGFIVGGANYGQGSSREHAALVPLYLGIRAVIAKSFARIHKANLVNAGILPLEFKNEQDYKKVFLGQRLSLSGIFAGLEGGTVSMTNVESGETFELVCDISARQAKIIRAGGLLNYTRQQQKLNRAHPAGRAAQLAEHSARPIFHRLRHARSAAFGGGLGTAGDTNDKEAANMVDINEAKERFAQLLEGQRKRVAAMRAQGDFVDYAKLEQIVIGVCGGDGIGPVITHEAERVLRFLLKSDVERGRIVFKEIHGLTIENRAACGKAIPDDVLAELKACNVILKGPTTTPRAGDEWPNIESGKRGYAQRAGSFRQCAPGESSGTGHRLDVFPREH